MFVENKFSVAIEAGQAITKNTRQNGQTPDALEGGVNIERFLFNKVVPAIMR